MQKKLLALTLMLGASIALVGCGGTTRHAIYSNDQTYPQAMYVYLQKDASFADQIEVMKGYLKKAEESGQKPAPGAYAHLALLYTKSKDYRAAETYFNMEKKAFPESAYYIDSLRVMSAK